jgi:type I restriction enzyme S subunit
MEKYENYKESGVDWIGKIPNSWSIWKIQHVYQQIGSGTTPQSGSDKFYKNGTINWLQTGDLTDNYVSTTSKRITKDALKEYSTLKIYPPGSLVMAMYGATIGKLAVTEIECCTNQACCVLRKSDQVLTKYMFYVLLGFRRNIISMGYGGGQPNISQNLIASLRLPIPPLPTQTTIATFLDQKTAQIDRAIAQKERLIELLRERKQIVIQQAVTRGLDPTVAMKDSGVEWIGEVPEHLEVKKMSHVAKISAGSTPDRSIPRYWNGIIPWVKTGEVNYDTIHSTEEQITEMGLRMSATKISPPGTLLMAMYGQGVTRGRVSLLGINAAYNQACCAMSFNFEIDELFAYWFFRIAYNYIRDDGNESSQMNISAGYIAQLRILKPPIKEQLVIISYVQKEHIKIDRSINLHLQQIAKLKEYRTVLIDAAVTGKIRI